MTVKRDLILELVPILALRPTQITVGMREVEDKRKRWREFGQKKKAKVLGNHMIPVVKGVGKTFYVIDHHHLALALHDEGVKEVLISLVADLSMVDKKSFWVVMDNHRWVHPYDENGERQSFAKIPERVSKLRTTLTAAFSQLCALAVMPRTPRRSASFVGRLPPTYSENDQAGFRQAMVQASNSPRATKRSICPLVRTRRRTSS